MKLTLTIKDLRTLLGNEQASITYCANTSGAPDEIVLSIPRFDFEKELPASFLLFILYEDKLELDIPHEIPV